MSRVRIPSPAPTSSQADALRPPLVDDADQESPRSGDGPDEAADRLERDPVDAAAQAACGDDRDGPDEAECSDGVADRHPAPRGKREPPGDPPQGLHIVEVLI